MNVKSQCYWCWNGATTKKYWLTYTMNQITKGVFYNFEKKKQAAHENWTILTRRSCVICSW
jgi:hypothetical protein